jgi:site-specific DNA-methyltransferase (adenine-specific)/modification methylase
MTKTEGHEIVRGDSRRLIKKVKGHSVDLILTDPPYNLGKYSTGNIELSWRKGINNDLAAWDAVDFDPAEWVREFKRILKPTGNLFAFTSYNLIGKWHEAFDPEFDTFQFMVWHKTNPVPKIYKAGFLNSCELIICCWNKGHTWNFISQKEMHNFIESPICMSPERLKEPYHPTQKPLKILKKIIEIASNPGDLVFDPFMGVGSTGIAALQMERCFKGFELDQKYFSAAKLRLEGSVSQFNRFERSK